MVRSYKEKWIEEMEDRHQRGAKVEVFNGAVMCMDE
jgi:hypothetical protein